MEIKNDRKFTIDFLFSETLEKPEFNTFTLWRKLEVCKSLEDVKETATAFLDELLIYIREKLEK